MVLKKLSERKSRVAYVKKSFHPFQCPLKGGGRRKNLFLLCKSVISKKPLPFYDGANTLMVPRCGQSGLWLSRRFRSLQKLRDTQYLFTVCITKRVFWYLS